MAWSLQGYFRIREMAAQLKEKREKESEARRKENGTARDASVEGGAAFRAAAESEGKEEKVGASALLCLVGGHSIGQRLPSKEREGSLSDQKKCVGPIKGVSRL